MKTSLIKKKIQVSFDDFKKIDHKIFLKAKKVAQTSIEFQSSKILPNIKNLEIANSIEKLLLAYSIRSSVYSQIGYDVGFENVSKGLDYDIYDKNSIVFLHKYKQESIIGTSRIIFDDPLIGLQSDKYINLDPLRKSYKLAEASRMVTLPSFKGLTNTVFNLIKQTYFISKSNDISHIICSVTPEHSKKYLCLGGVEIIAKNVNANLPTPLNVLVWNINKVKPILLRKWNSN